MLITIAIIASVVCALTALTTSLRALGKSREYGGYNSRDFRRIRQLYLIITGIWMVLSGLFIAPVFVREWIIGNYTLIFVMSSGFLIVFIVIVYIWKLTYAESAD